MTTPELPPVIDAYQRAHDRRDTDTAIATFHPDATVIDEDTTFTGTEPIRHWLTDAASEYTYTRTLTSVDRLDDDVYVVHNHLSGDFPGGEVDLRYRFELNDDLIHHLTIAP
jgi:hypothetical protein